MSTYPRCPHIHGVAITTHGEFYSGSDQLLSSQVVQQEGRTGQTALTAVSAVQAVDGQARGARKLDTQRASVRGDYTVQAVDRQARGTLKLDTEGVC